MLKSVHDVSVMARLENRNSVRTITFYFGFFFLHIH